MIQEKTITVEEAIAYSEVLEILRHMSYQEYNKVPKDMINMFKKNAIIHSNFRYDFNKLFIEQNISKDAKLILAILFRDYWATPNQRERIKKKQLEERIKLEEEIRKKYSGENIFNRNNYRANQDDSSKALIVKKEESILKRIIGKIIKIIKRKQ